MERAGHALMREMILHNRWRKHQLENEMSEQFRALIGKIKLEFDKYQIQQELYKWYI